MEETTIRALYALMEKTEIDKETYGIDTERMEQVKRAVSLFGYTLSVWYTGRTLVISSPPKEKPLSPHEVSALDLLSSIARTPNGIDINGLSECMIAKELLENKWIEINGSKYVLTKRAAIEKAAVLSKKSGIDICSFCSILNGEGNIPHKECSKYINRLK